MNITRLKGATAAHVNPSLRCASSTLVNESDKNFQNVVMPHEAFVAALVECNAAVPVNCQNSALIAEFEEVTDAIIFWKAAAAHAPHPLALAYAEKMLVRLKDKADRLAQEIEEC